MLATFDVCKLKKTDDKYQKIMSCVPNADKYDLYTVDKALFIPLTQVYDLMTAQPDTDTISRQAAIEAAIKGADPYYKDSIAEELMNVPSAQPQRMRAKWIATTSLQEGQITWGDYKCSNCSHHSGKPMNFCEVCGAKMER